MTQNISSISLVIPIYDNGKTAKKLLNECITVLKKTQLPFEIIICNDGSTDNTSVVIANIQEQENHLRIITHKKNLGIARSLQDLYRASKNRYTILFSVDGGWNPHDIAKLIHTIQNTKADIVIGKRKHKKYTLRRKIISAFYNNLAWIFFGVQTHDAGSIKIFKSDIYKNMKHTTTSVFFEAEFIIRSSKKGYKIVAVPISHHETPPKTKSGVHIKEIIKSFQDLIALRLTM